jgi:PST family polysaccharide transporter
VRAAGLAFTFNASSVVVQTGGVIFLARILGPQEFGLVEMVAVFALLLQNFTVNGFADAIVQKDRLDQPEVSNFFWLNVSVGVGLALLLMLAGPLIAWFYREPRLIPLAAVVALSVAAAGLGTQHTALLKRNFLFFEASLAEFLGSALSLGLGLLMAFAGAGYWSLAARRVAQPAITTAFSWIWCHWRPDRPSFSQGTGGLAKFGFNVWGNVSLQYVRENFDTMVVGRYFGSEVLGHYGRAYQFSRLLPSQIGYALSDVALSTLSTLSGDATRFRHYFSRMLETMALVSMQAACLLTIVGPAFLMLLLGPQWTHTGAMFAAFGPGTGVAVLYRTHGWLHMALGRPHRWWQWSIVATIVTVSGYIVALSLGLGPVSIAATFSVSMHLLLLPALWFAGRPHNFSIGFLLKPIWRYWVSALVTCVVILGIQRASWGGSSTPTVIELVWLSAECVLIYGACVVALHGGIAPISRLIGVLSELRPKRTPTAAAQAASSS